jgi:3-methyl-2-oxobutanoate hydroxymethyltransferase
MVEENSLGPNDRPSMNKVTAGMLAGYKDEGQRFAMLTAYDVYAARFAEAAEIPVLLVGDSLGMVVQGGDNTLQVTVDDIIYHTRAVRRGSDRAHVVADMPFMSYQTSLEDALRNAGRLIKEGGAEAVKLEGGQPVVETVRRLVESGIPVMGHLGLMPQSIHAMGGFRVQGKRRTDAHRIAREARALEDAGAYAIVLEGVPRELARLVTASLRIPTIGIGAGPDCDGQVLVFQDVLGMNPAFRPKFVKHYLTLGDVIPEALRAFREEVAAGVFPGDEHSYHASEALFGPVVVPPVEEDLDEDSGLEGVPV